MPRLAAAVCALVLLAPASAFARAPKRAAAPAEVLPRYDVAYAWRVDLASATKARARIGAVLGPRVRRRLVVVQAAGAYAVLYLRHADSRSAAATAAAHARVLGRHGLGRAFALPSARWVEMTPPEAPAGAVARKPTPPEPKEEAPDAGVKLEAAQDAEKRELERLLVEHVSQLRREGRLSRDERTAWSVYDFTTGEMLAEINADLELQAASLIKPFLALAYMHEVASGRLSYDDQARARMERMIQVSDNAAADWVMRRLGGPAAVQKLLRASYGGLLPGVEVKEYIPAGGRTYRNKATAGDYSRFLLALWRDELPEAREIKRLMGLPKRDRLRTGVPLPAETEVYDKTGSTSRLCGDMGVLLAKGPDGKQYAYTLIGLIEKQRPARHYFRWLRARGDVIREISALVYQTVGARHGFAVAR